jgi:hypothetical protein
MAVSSAHLRWPDVITAIKAAQRVVALIVQVRCRPWGVDFINLDADPTTPS